MNKNNLKFKDLTDYRTMLIQDEYNTVFLVLRFNHTLFHKHPSVVLGKISFYSGHGYLKEFKYTQENFDLEEWKLVYLQKED